MRVIVVHSRLLINCVTHSAEIHRTVIWNNTGDLKCSMGLRVSINAKAIRVLFRIECCCVQVSKKFKRLVLCCLLVPVKVVKVTIRVFAADVHIISTRCYNVSRLINRCTKRKVLRGETNGKFINIFCTHTHSSWKRV